MAGLVGFKKLSDYILTEVVTNQLKERKNKEEGKGTVSGIHPIT